MHKMLQTGLKVPIEYVIDDIDTYKKISLMLTLSFMIVRFHLI